MDQTPHDPTTWLASVVEEFCAGPQNSLRNGDDGSKWDEPAWDRPILGFARGDDPLFVAYKEHVGPFHWTPAEAYTLAYPDAPAPAGELTVIAWVLPQTRATKRESRRQTAFPGERWARSRILGEAFNEALRRHVVEALRGSGIPALAPVLLPEWEQRVSDRHGKASLWSERHTAHAAGLGTFGLCDGLITPLGKAVRLGSVIARMHVDVAPRPYADHHAYCTFYASGKCGKCIARCPAGAISEAGHDKAVCDAYVEQSIAHMRDTYSLEGYYGCGLCQTGVPCESKIPRSVRPAQP